MPDDVLLVWNPSSEPGVVGYKVYYGRASRTYGTPIDVKNNTSYTISGLGPETYYFAATAYTESGIESNYSKEVRFSTLPFAFIAVGAGYSTALTISNTGTDTVEGSLLLTDSSGSPLEADLAELSEGQQTEPGSSPVNMFGSSVGFTVTPNSSKVLSIGPLTPGGVMTAGWAKVVYSGGPVSGSAAVQFTEGGITKPIMGIPAGLIAASAFFAVEYDSRLSRYVGISLVNPNDEDISIQVYLFGMNGNMLDIVRPPELNPVRSHQQVRTYLHEVFRSHPFFRGSAALISQGGRRFVVTAALQDGDVYTTIPVVPLFP